MSVLKSRHDVRLRFCSPSGISDRLHRILPPPMCSERKPILSQSSSLFGDLVPTNTTSKSEVPYCRGRDLQTEPLLRVLYTRWLDCCNIKQANDPLAFRAFVGIEPLKTDRANRNQSLRKRRSIKIVPSQPYKCFRLVCTCADVLIYMIAISSFSIDVHAQG